MVRNHSYNVRVRGHAHHLAVALCAGVVLWTAALFAAPLELSSGNRVLSAAALAMYSAGAVVCHQRPERSFHIGATQLPVCARCTGLYVAAAAGAPLALLLAGSMSGARARTLAALAAAPTVVTWTIEMAGWAHPSNMVRAVAALPLGFVAAWLVLTTLTREAAPLRAWVGTRPPPR
jgi:uncharacterized membrane protein